jgi:hypothetical protein
MILSTDGCEDLSFVFASRTQQPLTEPGLYAHGPVHVHMLDWAHEGYATDRVDRSQANEGAEGHGETGKSVLGRNRPASDRFLPEGGGPMTRKQIVHDHDIDLQNDIVLCKMLEAGIPLTLENYVDLAFLGTPPDGIEEDGEFLALVPDIILEGPTRVQ